METKARSKIQLVRLAKRELSIEKYSSLRSESIKKLVLSENINSTNPISTSVEIKERNVESPSDSGQIDVLLKELTTKCDLFLGC